jgi:hypothetical protein
VLFPPRSGSLMDMLEQQRLTNEAKLSKAQEEMERSYEQKAAEFERKIAELEADVCEFDEKKPIILCKSIF